MDSCRRRHGRLTSEGPLGITGVNRQGSDLSFRIGKPPALPYAVCTSQVLLKDDPTTLHRRHAADLLLLPSPDDSYLWQQHATQAHYSPTLSQATAPAAAQCTPTAGDQKLLLFGPNYCLLYYRCSLSLLLSSYEYWTGTWTSAHR